MPWRGWGQAMSDEIRSWLDTPAGRFAATNPSTDPDNPFPTEHEFRWAEDEDKRLEARARFDAAWRPGQPPTAPYTVEERQRAYLAQKQAILRRDNWIEGDEEIEERLRRM